MAQSLKVIAWLLIGVTLAGCATMGTKSSPRRLSDVINTHDQADAAYRANDMQHAATLYLQLTRMVPQEADYWYMLGNAYVRTQEPDKAVQAYQQAIARNPNHSRAWHNLGIVRMRQAMAAFISSASTSKPGDPMYQLSTDLANELARIGSGAVGSGKVQNPVATVTAMPVTVTASKSRRKPGAAGTAQP